jgi:hypothetical protein
MPVVAEGKEEPTKQHAKPKTNRRDHSTKTDPTVSRGCRDIALKNVAGGVQAHVV